MSVFIEMENRLFIWIHHFTEISDGFPGLRLCLIGERDSHCFICCINLERLGHVNLFVCESRLHSHQVCVVCESKQTYRKLFSNVNLHRLGHRNRFSGKFRQTSNL